MVFLAKWIREHQKVARVLNITDRTELDEQIEKVFSWVNEDIYRTTSGADLLTAINKTDPWLIGSLVHKFRRSDADSDLDETGAEFIAELHSRLPANFSPRGNLYIFVDEAHRTQSGKMHKAMKESRLRVGRNSPICLAVALSAVLLAPPSHICQAQRPFLRAVSD